MNFRICKNLHILHAITIVALAEFSICTNIVLAQQLVPDDRLIRQAGKSFGQAAANRLKRWRRLIRQHRHDTEYRKLLLVNRFFNRIRVVSDRRHWHKEDYWATPLELLISNGGDSEDFAIAKYFTLKAMGVAVEKMRMVYVKTGKSKRTHMILAYYPHPKRPPLILDNLVRKILPAAQRKDLSPVYSFNGDYLWLVKELKDTDDLVGSSSRIQSWKRLKQRMQRQSRTLVIRH